MKLLGNKLIYLKVRSPIKNEILNRQDMGKQGKKKTLMGDFVHFIVLLIAEKY